jgi:hypothetical protein
MLPYFIGDFLVPQIALGSKSLFLQRFGNFPGVVGEFSEMLRTLAWTGASQAGIAPA